MFKLGLCSIAVVHNRTDISFSARETASDYWCRPIIDHLLYLLFTPHEMKGMGSALSALIGRLMESHVLLR